MWTDSKEAIALTEQIGDGECHARATMSAGILTMAGRSVAEGRVQLEQAIAEIEAAGFTYRLVSAHAFLGYFLAYPGEDLDRARKHARRAMALGREIGLQAFVSLALTALGIAATLHDDEPSARRHLGEALAAGPAQRAAHVRSAGADLVRSRRAPVRLREGHHRDACRQGIHNQPLFDQRVVT